MASCYLCLKPFKSSRLLQIHQRSHVKTESGRCRRDLSKSNADPLEPSECSLPWACGSCVLSFSTASLLEIHQAGRHCLESDGTKVLGKLLRVMKGGNSGFPALLDTQMNSFYSTSLSGGDPMLEDSGSSVQVVQQVFCPSCEYFVGLSNPESAGPLEINADLASVILKMLADHTDVVHAHRYEVSERRCRFCLRLLSSVDQREAHETASHQREILESLRLQRCHHICQVCSKPCASRSALAVHVKSHQRLQRYFSCCVCRLELDDRKAYLVHVETHRDATGRFPCQHCGKFYHDFTRFRSHYRYAHVHSYKCEECGKEFTRIDKLNLHKLSHNDVRAALCPVCGKQFKRNDKMKSHWKKKHNDETRRVEDAVNGILKSAAGQAKTPLRHTDYDRSVFKCQPCLLGFRRRGMLVNHMANRHPDISIDSIPELSAPLIKPRRIFNCQYCDKSYLSAGKRKKHADIFHAGLQEANERGPKGSRKNATAQVVSNGIAFSADNFSELLNAGTEHLPHQCPSCYKQYSSRNALVEHVKSVHKVNPAQRELAPKQSTSNTTTASMFVAPCHYTTTQMQQQGDDLIPVNQTQEGTYMFVPSRTNRFGEGQSGVHVVSTKPFQSQPQCSSASVIPLHLGSSGGQVEFMSQSQMSLNGLTTPVQTMSTATFQSPFLSPPSQEILFRAISELN